MMTVRVSGACKLSVFARKAKCCATLCGMDTMTMGGIWRPCRCQQWHGHDDSNQHPVPANYTCLRARHSVVQL